MGTQLPIWSLGSPSFSMAVPPMRTMSMSWGIGLRGTVLAASHTSETIRDTSPPANQVIPTIYMSSVWDT